jgi:LysR family glycine cleavage system transcriptional activator/LysR family transcriptional regulator of beta-lactamase
LELSESGRVFGPRLSDAFRELESAVSSLQRRPGGPSVTVAVGPTFAMRWLIPRLPSVQAAHPGVEVRLATTEREVDLLREDVDVAIRFGHGRWPKLRADLLMPDEAFPVASPALIRRLALRRPADLARAAWLVVERPPRGEDWPRWLAAAKLAGLEPQGRLVLESSSQALEAAVAGLGVAIGHRPFVADDLASGRLAAPFAPKEASGEAWWLVSAEVDAELPRIRAFRDWILSQSTGNLRSA